MGHNLTADSTCSKQTHKYAQRIATHTWKRSRLESDIYLPVVPENLPTCTLGTDCEPVNLILCSPKIVLVEMEFGFAKGAVLC